MRKTMLALTSTCLLTLAASSLAFADGPLSEGLDPADPKGMDPADPKGLTRGMDPADPKAQFQLGAIDLSDLFAYLWSFIGEPKPR